LWFDNDPLCTRHRSRPVENGCECSVEALDELGRQPHLLVDLDALPGAHDPQLRVLLADPRLRRVGVGVDHEDGVAGPHLGLGIAAEPAREPVPHAPPVHRGIRRVQRHLARPGRRRVAIDRDARAVRPAVAHLGQHRPQMLTHALLEGSGLAEQPDDSAHLLPLRLWHRI
jgi:hypothetical protein